MGSAGEMSGFHAEKSIGDRVRTTLTGANELRAFHYTHLFKVILLLLPLEIALVLFFMPFSIDFDGFPIEGVIVLSTISIGVLGVYIFFFWKTWKPALIIRSDKLKYNPITLGRGFEIDWNRIEGLMEDEVPYTRFKSVKILKIVYRKMNDTVGQIVLNQNILQKGNEVFSFLKRIIPPGPSADVYSKLEDLKRSQMADVKYKNIVLNNQGLNIKSTASKKTASLPWAY